MAWRYHGHASVDPDAPRAFATCDRCGFLYQLASLHFQHQWCGPKIQNLRLLVCDDCLDIPAPFLRALILAPDPDPIFNVRPEQYSIDETDYRVTEPPTEQIRETEDPLDQPRITENDVET